MSEKIRWRSSDTGLKTVRLETAQGVTVEMKRGRLGHGESAIDVWYVISGGYYAGRAYTIEDANTIFDREFETQKGPS